MQGKSKWSSSFVGSMKANKYRFWSKISLRLFKGIMFMSFYGVNTSGIINQNGYTLGLLLVHVRREAVTESMEITCQWTISLSNRKNASNRMNVAFPKQKVSEAWLNIIFKDGQLDATWIGKKCWLSQRCLGVSSEEGDACKYLVYDICA